MQRGEALIVFSSMLAVYLVLHIICIIHDIRHNGLDFTDIFAILGGILVLVLCVSFFVVGIQILIKTGI